MLYNNEWSNRKHVRYKHTFRRNNLPQITSGIEKCANFSWQLDSTEVATRFLSCEQHVHRASIQISNQSLTDPISSYMSLYH